MDENRCCGNVDSSYAKDMDSFCVREFLHKFEVCYEDSDHHTRIINGWTEITPDNVDEIDAIDPNRVVIATMIEGIVFSSVRADSDITLKSCSELGGYYFFILPELKKGE
jgi:hypothetical protein